VKFCIRLGNLEKRYHAAFKVLPLGSSIYSGCFMDKPLEFDKKTFSLLLAVAGIVGFAWLRSKSKTPIHESSDSAHGQNNTQNPTNTAHSEIRASLGFADLNHPSAAHKQNESQKQKKHWLKRRKVSLRQACGSVEKWR
jgi:hypothetical protein